MEPSKELGQQFQEPESQVGNGFLHPPPRELFLDMNHSLKAPTVNSAQISTELDPLREGPCAGGDAARKAEASSNRRSAAGKHVGEESSNTQPLLSLPPKQGDRFNYFRK